MKRFAVRFLIFALGLALLGGGGLLAWQLRERRSTFYTDAGSIRASTDEAVVRDVMWEPSDLLAGAVNTTEDEFTPRLTADGASLLFVRGRAGRNADIYISRRQPDGWGPPEPLTSINTEADELDPEPSADGMWLYFHSNRAGGLGGYDLWVARKGADGWEEPRNLGPDVNSRYHDYGPSLTPDGAQLYFASNRPGADEVVDPDMTVMQVARDAAVRTYDIFAATVGGGVVYDPKPVAILNTSHNEGSPAVSPSGDFVYFSSNRPDGLGGFDVYRARRVLGELRSPGNVGEAINTEADELDPACGLGGFALHFASNRPRQLADGRWVNDFDLHFAKSKEVFRQSETYRAEVDWSQVWSLMGPFLFWLILTLLVVLSLVRLQRAELRKITLIARCLLVSLLVHMVIMLALSFWNVKTMIQGMMKERGGTKVVLTSNSVGSQLAGQMRGNLTQVEPSSAQTDPSPRQQSELPTETPVTEATLAVEPAVVAAQAQPLASTEVSEAPAEPTPTPTMTASMPTDLPIALPLEMPAQPTATSAAEAAPAAPSASINDTRLAANATDVIPSQSEPSDSAVTVNVARVDVSDSGTNTRPLVDPVVVHETSAPAPTAAQAAPAPPTMAALDTMSFLLPSESAAPAATVAETGDDAPQPTGTVEAAERHVASVLSPAVLEPTVTATVSGVTDALDVTTPAIEINASDPARAASVPAVESAPPMVEPVTDAFAVELALPDAASMPSAVASDMPAATTTTVTADMDPAERAAVDLATKAPADTVTLRADRHDGLSAEDRTFAAAPTEVTIATDELWPDALAATAPGDEASTPTADLPQLEEALAAGEEDADDTPAAVATDVDRAAVEAMALLNDPSAADTMRSDVNAPDFVAVPLVTADDVDERPELIGPLDEAAIDFNDDVETAPTQLVLDMPAAPATPYSQRAPEARQEVLEARGGSRETEQAVASALAWLAKHQSPDGRWSGRQFDDQCGRCGGPAKVNSDIALTGLTLLCFFAADHAHHRAGPYQETVRRGLLWLAARQDRFGDLTGLESMYSHGIASMALAEAYGMSQDPSLAGPVRSAVDFIYRARNRRVGGWRYDPGQAGDTSVTGWQIMALTSAKRAGLDVPEEAFDVAERWLLKVRDTWKPELYSYQPKRRPTPAMTAEAVFIHQMIGSDPEEVHMGASAKYLTENLPDWEDDANTYYWYYATLALFQYGGEPWEMWNERMKNQLLANQVSSGPAAGSWNPDGKWANVGGRVYQTALCTLTLEVYYRYLPLYVSDAVGSSRP